MIRRALIAFVLVALCAALPASAADRTAAPRLTGLSDQVVGGEARPSPAGVILRDTFGGALAGAAVGGIVVVCNRYCSSGGTWDNWGRTVGIGAAIGAGVGLIWGVVDTASYSDTVPRGPIADERATGFAPAAPVYGGRF